MMFQATILLAALRFFVEYVVCSGTYGIHLKVKTVLLKLFVINRAFMHQKEIKV